MSKQTEETAARTAAQETFDHAYQHPRLPGYRCAQCGATAADHARAEQTTSAPREAGEVRNWSPVYSHEVSLAERIETETKYVRDLLAENARLREVNAELLGLARSVASAPYSLTPDQWQSEARAVIAAAHAAIKGN